MCEVRVCVSVCENKRGRECVFVLREIDSVCVWV